jgi:hypothetical protein
MSFIPYKGKFSELCLSAIQPDGLHNPGCLRIYLTRYRYYPVQQTKTVPQSGVRSILFTDNSLSRIVEALSREIKIWNWCNTPTPLNWCLHNLDYYNGLELKRNSQMKIKIVLFHQFLKENVKNIVVFSTLRNGVKYVRDNLTISVQ